MNVLFLINHAGQGGTEKYIRILTDMLIENGDNVYFVYNESGLLSNDFRRQGIMTYQMDMKSPYDFNAANKLTYICKQNNINIIHHLSLLLKMLSLLY